METTKFKISNVGIEVDSPYIDYNTVDYDLDWDNYNEDRFNNDADYIASQLDNVTDLSLYDLEVTDADMDRDGTTGKLTIEVEIRANRKITDKDELKYLAECIVDDIHDMITVYAYGYYESGEDDFGYGGYYERETTTNVDNEAVEFSIDQSDMEISLLD